MRHTLATRRSAGPRLPTRRLVHLVLHVLLKAAQEMIGAVIKEGLGAVTAVPVQELEEKAEAATGTLRDKGAEPKERLAERVDVLQERVKEEVGKVKDRVADGLKSAAQDGTRSSSFGRPLTGHPPSLRPPSGRPPSGCPPSARPPAGRHRSPGGVRRGATIEVRTSGWGQGLTGTHGSVGLAIARPSPSTRRADPRWNAPHRTTRPAARVGARKSALVGSAATGWHDVCTRPESWDRTAPRSIGEAPPRLVCRRAAVVRGTGRRGAPADAAVQ